MKNLIQALEQMRAEEEQRARARGLTVEELRELEGGEGTAEARRLHRPARLAFMCNYRRDPIGPELTFG